MWNKKGLYAIVAIFIMGMGFYLGYNGKDVSAETASISNDEVDKTDINKVNDGKEGLVVGQNKSRSPASVSPLAPIEKNTIHKRDYYNKNQYWKKLQDNQNLVELYNKALSLFKKSPEAEDIAVWIALGVIFDSSKDFGEVLNFSLAEINKNAQENFNLLKDVTKNLPPEESFFRSMVLNLANGISVSGDEKVSYFGSEIIRPAKLDKEGKFTPDSLNITTAMIFLKNHASSEEEVKKFAAQALQNNKDPLARKKVLTRLSTYFPSAVR